MTDESIVRPQIPLGFGNAVVLQTMLSTSCGVFYLSAGRYDNHLAVTLPL